MRSRMLESKGCIRACIDYAQVITVDNKGILLKTFSKTKIKNTISSADIETVTKYKEQGRKEVIEGVIKIDICADDVIRVRYKEGTEVPENITPMVIGGFEGPVISRILTRSDEDGKVVFQTNKVELTLYLNPYSIEIKQLESQNKVSIGGREKNYFENWDSANTGICYIPETNFPIAVENFSLDHNEGIYGFGEKFIRLNKVGQTIDLNMEDGIGVTTPRSYKNIPFYVSTKGYGVFFNHSSLMTFWVGSMSACDLQVGISDDFLDYYIFTGSIKEVLNNYTSLTGKGEVPPKWTFGYWQSKISYSSAKETLEIVKRMREDKIPCDVIHLDTFWFKKDWYCDLEFDRERFPNPEAYFAEMKEAGIKISLWQLPYIPEGSELFEKLKSVNGFVKDRRGEIYNVKICFVEGFRGIVGIVDYTNPEAVRVHKDAISKLFRMGAKIIKTDFGEAAPVDGVYFDGTPGERMHNLYPLLYNQAISEVTREEAGHGAVWARSAWAGSQRYPIHWGGDNSPNYMNLIPQLEGGLSLGLSGFQFWSQDVGGFLGDTQDRLLIRWIQLGVFLSHIRIHGLGEREIYKFNRETVEICRKYLQLRYRLIPYIYGSALEAVRDSLPIVRALVIDYQNDPNVWNISDQFLFGESMMIAPIYDEGCRRTVYFPEGTWTSWWTGERIRGGHRMEIEADIKTIPVYIREGAVIPMGPVMNYVDEVETNKMDLLISLFETENTRSFVIPVNEERVPVTYKYSNGEHVVRIGKTEVEINLRVYGESAVKVIRE